MAYSNFNNNIPYVGNDDFPAFLRYLYNDEAYTTNQIIDVVSEPYKYKEEYIKLIDKAEKKPGGNIYYPFHTDDRFKPLINFVEENANIYAKAHKYPDYYKIYESWAIDYPPKTNQPFHAHDGSIITCLFYLDVDENDTGTIFKSPYYFDDQNPLNVNIYSAVEDSIYNEFTFKTIQYKPKPGRLLVWRSFVEHATHPKEDNGKKTNSTRWSR